MSRYLLSVSIISIISALMLYFTDIIPSFGEWYSFDPSLRLQTDAFLRGELAIQPVPYGHRHDWAWGNGMQIVRGLGVPLIQLPFHIVARLFGQFAFPERLIFLFFYIFVAAVFWRSLQTINPVIFTKGLIEGQVQRIVNLFFAFLNPTFINMMFFGFGAYEEIIAYGYLWAFMLLALTIIFMKNRQKNIYFLLCFLAGFSPNIRPTIGAYGGITFLICFYYSRGITRWSGIPIFLTGIIFLLATNYMRYGSPLEFGHGLILSVPRINYLAIFDNPMNWAPFTSAARELISILFFINIDELSQNVVPSWIAQVPRLREFTFAPYNSHTPALLILAWIVGGILIFRKTSVSHEENQNSVIRFGTIWSFCSFMMLFYFYSYTPSIASRYAIDFGPAIIIGIVMLYLFLNNLVKSFLPSRFSSWGILIFGGIVIVFIFMGLSNLRVILIYPQLLDKTIRTNVTTLEEAKKEHLESRHTSGPVLPSVYRCGDSEKEYGIPYNNLGWNTGTDCSVSLVTTHFLEAPTCIAIQVEPLNGIQGARQFEFYDEIEVKMGLERLRRTSEKSIGKGKAFTFCSKYEEQKKFEMISIKWIDLRKHLDLYQSLLPLKLISIEGIR